MQMTELVGEKAALLQINLSYKEEEENLNNVLEKVKANYDEF
jgi:hypothetical protein